MIFDLTKINFENEITEQLKIQHYNTVERLIKTGERENSHNKKITLYHGTTLKNFNDILLFGLQSRDKTKISNFTDKLASVEGLVYLTSKWHYWYAFKAFENMKKYNNDLDKGMNIPCYVDVEVLSDNLVMDEDFFHSKYILTLIKNTLKKRVTEIEITYQDCISHYGTVAHIGGIPRDNLKNLTILASSETLLNNFINPRSQYMKDLQKWGKGKGKGSLKINDLFELEDHKYNLIFDLSKIPLGYIIDSVKFDKSADTYRLSFSKAFK